MTSSKIFVNIDDSNEYSDDSNNNNNNNKYSDIGKYNNDNNNNSDDNNNNNGSNNNNDEKIREKQSMKKPLKEKPAIENENSGANEQEVKTLLLDVVDT
ncbi:hypothetical protein C923_01870 [Plasmodium falciparum UGT5.1]|uniref:Uncharacterized protein n=1 Tax=Plasmodium falciparum UGT5.1 TaxID=1237627 RepID=W7JR45_PLAFA|nr:hypothetical protein C923_01870 [Plasmodium falciparum UGT5.1]